MIQKYIALLACLVFLGSSAVGTYWAWFDQSVPLTVNSETLATTGAIHPGDTIIIRRNYCVTADVPVVMRRYIIGRTIAQLPNTVLPTDLGCHVLDFRIDLPLHIAPDQYVYKTTAVFERNPLQSEAHIQMPDVPFEVSP